MKINDTDFIGIFDNIDQVMNTLYNDAWQSQGAEGAKSRYQQIRKNYETFYKACPPLGFSLYFFCLFLSVFYHSF